MVVFHTSRGQNQTNVTKDTIKSENKDIVTSTGSNEKYYTKHEYTDSIDKRIIIQNSLPKGGLKYIDPNGKEYIKIGDRVQLSEHHNEDQVGSGSAQLGSYQNSFQAHRATNRFKSSIKWFEKRPGGCTIGLYDIVKAVFYFVILQSLFKANGVTFWFGHNEIYYSIIDRLLNISIIIFELALFVYEK